jgi:16S rRNA (uracil1498-N3)-methyltransferase
MSRRRWIADEVRGDAAALTGSHARHLAQVLRAKVGQQFDIATGAEVRRGTILSIQSDRVDFALGDLVREPSQVSITVALSIFKFDRMEWAIEKCTELGVDCLIPLFAARSDSHLVAASQKRVERWRRLAHQAAEQSRRSRPPEVAVPKKLSELLTVSPEVKVVLAETEDHSLLKDTLPPRTASMVLAVGPEGGWTRQELLRFHDAGWASASLGQTILRAETAAVAAVAVALSVLQNL